MIAGRLVIKNCNVEETMSIIFLMLEDEPLPSKQGIKKWEPKTPAAAAAKSSQNGCLMSILKVHKLRHKKI